VLLMGKSGSGKSSMRSIIFSNFVARDVRRLGATIDVEHSHAKFMGSLTLNLWDCGGQDAFMDSYLNTQRENVFSDAEVLIYVFDIESRDVERDLETYSLVVRALAEYSPTAHIFGLVHKMDLVQNEHRDRIYEERVRLIKARSGDLMLTTFASSIWDQTLYKAWAGIVHALIPNLRRIEKFLQAFARQMRAEECVLFERSTFLTVTSVSGRVGKGDENPNPDRHERISNILKSYRHTISRSTSTSPSASGFILFKVQTPHFNCFLARFTENTYIFVAMPIGEAGFNVAVINTMMAREVFAKEVDGG
jgi:Ras-related GTP-binding protein A/B